MKNQGASCAIRLTTSQTTHPTPYALPPSLALALRPTDKQGKAKKSKEKQGKAMKKQENQQARKSKQKHGKAMKNKEKL